MSKAAHKHVRSKNEDESSPIINNKVITYDIGYSYMESIEFKEVAVLVMTIGIVSFCNDHT